ncbi:hypothetical protein PG995_011861 [Apiospora arundinis]
MSPRQDKSRRITITRRKTAATFDVPQFTQNEVPPEPVLESMLAHPATPAYLSGMTAAQCHSLLSEYASRTLLLKDPARDFREVFRGLLERGGGSSSSKSSPTPEEMADKTRALHATLHSIAGMLVQGPPGPVYNLALHILHALCKLDYAPSVLTVTRIALVSRKIDQPQWAPAVERFERLVKSLTAYRPSSSSKSKKAKGNNSGEAETTRIEEVEEEASLRANAFTLKGLIIVASNQARPKPLPEGYREALKYFESAVGSSSNRSRSNSSSSPTSSFFDWQISCMVEMGHCYAALGDHPKAHAAWKFAAEELDDKDATALYAVHALQQDDPAREALLVKAAVSESELAVAELNRIYSDNLRDQEDKGEGEEIKKQGEAKWDTLFKKVARSEWEKLSSPPATTGTK